MSSPGWEQLERVLKRAFEHETHERLAYVERECPPELRSQAEAIVRADQQAGDFLANPLLGDRTEVALPELIGRSPKPDQIGPYRVLRELGSGGMGSVYLAVRDDEHLHQMVAIKVVDPRRGGPDAVRRFRNERQILARLEHPNIAHIHDGGATADGSLYLVLEYVAGQPIDIFCEQMNPSLRERLRLMLDVCSAVSFAQRNLIVHRDLKPANILVTADGVAKLLDFGIAKILSPDAFPHGVEVTATGMHPMTLQYASPEQLRGEPITTATDVYALGLLLYEVLTGRRPYELREMTPTEVERAICDIDPPRPSLASSHPEGPVAPRRLRGDLDNILLKALAKDPQQRYGSARQLSDDIERYLDGQPVLARKASWRYRSGKFLRRHALAASAASLFGLTVFGFSVHASMQAERLQVERDQARLERDRAEQMTGFLMDIFSEANPERARGETLTARQILDRGVRRIRSSLAGQPEIRARLLETIGLVYDELGQWDEAATLLGEALVLRRRGVGNEQELADTLGHLSEVHANLGAWETAEIVVAEALSIGHRLGGETLADGLTRKAQLRNGQGRYKEAEELLRRSLAIQTEQLGRDHWGTAATLNSLALALDNQGAHASAAKYYREALELFRRHGGADHPHVALTLHNLGSVLSAAGDDEGARQYLGEALRLRRRLLGSEHPRTTKTMANLSAALTGLGETEAALPLAREALANRQKLFPEPHFQLAHSYYILAHVLEKSGQLQEAEANFREALDVQHATLPAGHPVFASTLGAIGHLKMLADQADAAEPLLQKALDIRRAALPVGHPLIARAALALGECHVKSKKLAEAEPLLQEALDRYRDTDSERAQSAAVALQHLYEAQGNSERAAEYRALAETRKAADA